MSGRIEVTIGELARKRGIRSAAELQRQAHISYNTAYLLFNDRAEGGITFDVLRKICSVLEKQPGDILHFVPGSQEQAGT